MIDYQKLLTFLEEYTLHYREVLTFETFKLELIVSDDIEGLNNSLSKEQALIMKTNSLENKRLELIGRENEKKTLKEIIADAPFEFQPRLQSKYEDLSKIIFQIKKINDNAQEIVSTRLSVLENIKNGTPSNTYTKKGGKKNFSESTSTLNKDI